MIPGRRSFLASLLAAPLAALGIREPVAAPKLIPGLEKLLMFGGNQSLWLIDLDTGTVIGGPNDPRLAQGVFMRITCNEIKDSGREIFFGFAEPINLDDWTKQDLISRGLQHTTLADQQEPHA